MDGEPAAGAPAGVVFVIPPGRPPSGGDVYNLFLLRALSAEGLKFDAATLAAFNSRTGPPPAEVWIDSLYIPDPAVETALRQAKDAYFIVHSVPSLDPGLPRAAARRLRSLEDRLFRSARGFLVTGPWTRDVLIGRGLADRPIFLVPPAPCLTPSGNRPSPSAFAGLIVSSLVRGKGVPVFLDRLGRDVRDSDRFSIRIAGRADIEPAAALASLRLIDSHPVLRRRVDFLGSLPLDKLGEEYERSSVFLSPSSSETFGMAFHEALAFGLPVLAVKAPYSEPFIEAGRTGLLFRSARAMARGMLDLVRRPERFQALAASAASRRRTADYTWTDAARAWLKRRGA